MWFITALLWFAVGISGDGSPTILQRPQSVVERPGGSPSLDCSLERSSNPNFYWYKQLPGGQIEQLSYSISQGSSTNVGPAHIQGTRPSDSNFILAFTSLSTSDTGTYYCAWSTSFSGERLHFGQGTRLTVLEKGQKTSPPEVTIFAPSAQEVKDKQKATIVCLATDFFPDHVNLTWFMNGEARTEGVKTDTPELDKTKKKYSLVSRLRITKKEWQDSNNEFKCRIAFYDENGESHYEDEISGIECGGSAEAKETYLRRANVGKLVYILLIFKSFLYGAFVMGLKLQKKVVP